MSRPDPFPGLPRGRGAPGGAAATTRSRHAGTSGRPWSDRPRPRGTIIERGRGEAFAGWAASRLLRAQRCRQPWADYTLCGDNLVRASHPKCWTDTVNHTTLLSPRSLLLDTPQGSRAIATML